jgi:flagellar motor switch protein FliN/FliY
MEEESNDLIGTKPVVARSASFPQFSASESSVVPGTPLDLMLDVSVTLTAEFGKAVLPLGEILKLGVGSVVQLDRLVSEPVEIYVKGVLLARGEVVVVNDRFAIHLKEIMQPRQKSVGRSS